MLPGLSVLAERFRLRALLFAECPFIKGELGLAPTSVLELMDGSPWNEFALDTGRDCATPA